MNFNKIIFPMRRRGATGGTGAQGEGVTSLLPRIDAAESRDTLKRLYVSATGNPSNNGLSESNAVQTFDQALSLVGSVGQYRIMLLSDVTWSGSPIFFYNPPCSIWVEADDTRRKITATDTASLTVDGYLGLDLDDIDIELNATNSTGLFRVRRGLMNFNYVRGNVTETGSNQKHLLERTGAALLSMNLSSYTNSTNGRFLRGLDNGGDPNSNPFVTSNDTSV